MREQVDREEDLKNLQDPGCFNLVQLFNKNPLILLKEQHGHKRYRFPNVYNMGPGSPKQFKVEKSTLVFDFYFLSSSEYCLFTDC